MNESVAMVRLEGVTKRYLLGEVPVTAVNEVNLEFQRGDFVSIMGPSGSGKSTVLNILGALDVPTSGKYYLEDHLITGLSDFELSKIRNQHFGFIFQAYNLFPESNAVENVEMPLIYAKVKPAERRKRAKEMLDRLKLSHRLNHYPSQLSGGEQQRVAIARALINDPTLLLADEPTGNLSKEMGEEILDFLLELNSQGVSIIVVTHDPQVGSMAKRQVRLEDGRVVSDTVNRQEKPKILVST